MSTHSKYKTIWYVLMDMNSTEDTVSLKSDDIEGEKESAHGVGEPNVNIAGDTLLCCARVRSNLGLQEGLGHRRL